LQGFAINFISGTYHFGWPRLADGVIDLFESEYNLPLLPLALGGHASRFWRACVSGAHLAGRPWLANPHGQATGAYAFARWRK
jgi:hypothetical protein